MKFSINLKINGLNIFLLGLILLNVFAAYSNFKEIGRESQQISRLVERNNQVLANPNLDFLEMQETMVQSNQEFTKIAETIYHLENRAVRLQFLILIFNVLVGVALSIILSRQITNPLKHTILQLNHIAKGNLTQPSLHITTSDEVGEIAEALNSMKKDLTRTFSNVLKTGLEVEKVAHAMTQSANRTSSSVKTIVTGADNQAKTVKEASSSMDAMNTTIRHVTNSTHEALSSARAVSKQARDGEIAVTHTVEAMKQIEESSGKIEAIVAVITDITNQTNLLSLNAAIEAAKAGEMGKGFAVVADEIRHLAERSAGATQEIFDLITESTERVNNGTELVENTGRALKDILNSVQKASGLIDTIADSISKHREEIIHVEDTLKILDNISQNTVTSAGRLSHTTQELDHTTNYLENVATRLHSIIEQFNLPHDE
ncbi:MAG: HAMP domain-containing protein [SAR324 cluster bacterium]|nr:HAMP domain-containing protein [SAR324 cluster bacterium]